MTAFANKNSNGRNTNMFRRHFNATTIIAIVALVFAMTGGAFAVTSKGGSPSTATVSGKGGSSSSASIAAKKKKKKKFTPKGARGPRGLRGATGATGPAGPQGLAGPVGPAGKDGTPGANGTNGKDGESVASAALKAGEGGCAEGGSKFTVGGKSTSACNGEKGVIHPGETLASEASETGMWNISTPSGEGVNLFKGVATISFPIPLKAEIPASDVHVISEGKNGAGGGTCPTTSSVSKPEAEPGNLCIFVGYQEAVLSLGLVNLVAKQYGEVEAKNVGAATTGIGIFIYKGESNEATFAGGSWAVTAE